MAKILREPRVSEAELQPQEPPAIKKNGFPFLTIALLITLVSIFACEYIFALEPPTGLLAPSIHTMVALGALNINIILQSNEWYRVLSSTLLHADLKHLLFNGVALYMAGVILESLVGRAWLFTLFFIGALSGSFMSLAINPSNMVSIGASGAIMGLLAAAFVCTFRLPNGAIRTQAQMNLMQVLIPSLIPIAISRTGEHIDFGAHFGGALSGFILGYFLLKNWPKTDPLPQFTDVARIISIVGLTAFCFAIFSVINNYHP